MASGSLPTNPFVPTGMIEDTRLFIGRQEELRAIASRMTGVQPISINIVGDKRIGKSSLCRIQTGLVPTNLDTFHYL